MLDAEADWKKYNDDGVYVDVCPVEIFGLHDQPEYPDSQKSVPVCKEECMACVTSCPTEAITVEE